MTPKEKLQKKIDDTERELGAAQAKVEQLQRDHAMLIEMKRVLFGGGWGHGKGGRRPAAEVKAAEEKFLAVLDREQGLSLRDIARKLYGDGWDGTISQRIKNWIKKGRSKGTVEVVEGSKPRRYRKKM